MKDVSISKQSGFSTLELLIAITIIITAISTVIIVVFSNQTVSLDNQLNDEALIKATNLIEQARSSASFDFSSLGNLPTANDDIYKKELMVTDINPCRKTGIASVSWSTDPKRTLQIQLQTIFSNPSEAIALGGDCGPDSPPATQWWYPFTFKDYDLKTIPPTALQSGNAGVGATSIDVIRRGSKYAILTTNSGSEKDIWVINVDDGKNASISASKETTKVGLNNADVEGNYVFALTVGSAATPSDLQIIDISTITSPNLVATRSLDISSSDANYVPNAQAIFYYGGKIYVGTHRTGGNEFQIFSGASPFDLIKGLELNHNINSIIVRGDYAYLATSDNTGELMIVNINPLSTEYMKHPDVTGMKYDATGDYDAISLFLMSDKLYLGREGGNYSKADASNFMVLDIGNPHAISLLGAKFISDNNGPNKATGIIAMSIVDTFAFISTDDADTDFQVFRVGDPANIYNCNELNNPSYPANCGLYNFPQNMVDLEYFDSYIYAAIKSNATFRIIWDDVTKY